MNIRVVPMSAAHLPEVIDLGRVCLLAAWTRETFSISDAPFVALNDAGNVVGCASLTDGYINHVAVRPDCWRRGVASRILRTLFQVAERRRFATLTLHVRESNAAAIALYRSLGFRVTERRGNFYAVPTGDALTMTRSVSAPES